jgi:hypothetical protein
LETKQKICLDGLENREGSDTFNKNTSNQVQYNSVESIRQDKYFETIHEKKYRQAFPGLKVEGEEGLQYTPVVHAREFMYSTRQFYP